MYYTYKTEVPSPSPLSFSLPVSPPSSSHSVLEVGNAADHKCINAVVSSSQCASMCACVCYMSVCIIWMPSAGVANRYRFSVATPPPPSLSFPRWHCCRCKVCALISRRTAEKNVCVLRCAGCAAEIAQDTSNRRESQGADGGKALR